MSFWAKLKLVFTYPDELDELLQGMKEKRLLREHRERSQYVNLCKRHQPREPGAHFAEHNCHVCKLLKGQDVNLSRYFSDENQNTLESDLLSRM